MDLSLTAVDFDTALLNWVDDDNESLEVGPCNTNSKCAPPKIDGSDCNIQTEKSGRKVTEETATLNPALLSTLVQTKDFQNFGLQSTVNAANGIHLPIQASFPSNDIGNGWNGSSYMRPAVNPTLQPPSTFLNQPLFLPHPAHHQYTYDGRSSGNQRVGPELEPASAKISSLVGSNTNPTVVGTLPIQHQSSGNLLYQHHTHHGLGAYNGLHLQHVQSFYPDPLKVQQLQQQHLQHQLQQQQLQQHQQLQQSQQQHTKNLPEIKQVPSVSSDPLMAQIEYGKQFSSQSVSRIEGTRNKLSQVAGPATATFSPPVSNAITQQSPNISISAVTAAAAAAVAPTIPMPPQPQSSEISKTTVSRKKNKVGKKSSNQSTPPFYLFDAPCELRCNFNQSQIMHNMPLWRDNNSYHYGMAVNGFHPRLNAQENPPVLIDARHKAKKAGKERNEREQRRAQKITELIESLRLSMVKGGWKVEMKSKFHTLSSCADYVKHLMKDTSDKEKAVEQAKSDLEKQERLLDDFASSEGRSDPESVTSSLTALTEKSKGVIRKRVSEADSQRNSNKLNVGYDSNSSQGSCSSLGEEEEMINTVSGSVSVNDEGSDHAQEEVFSKDAVGKIDAPKSELHTKTLVEEKEEKRAEFSCEKDAKDTEAKDCDVVTADLPTSDKECSSLDYEEVFWTSNVPQLIATSAGKIISWNNFFLKATGLSVEEVKLLSLFSIVKADKLSNLFEIVGAALRGDRVSIPSDKEEIPTSLSCANDDKESLLTSTKKFCERKNYESVTLPCISFPSNSTKNKHPNMFHMTVSLMNDGDIQKRCFHCILTDHPCENGRLGFVTPDLLARLCLARPDSSVARGSQESVIMAKTELSDGNAIGDEVGNVVCNEVGNAGCSEQVVTNTDIKLGSKWQSEEKGQSSVSVLSHNEVSDNSSFSASPQNKLKRNHSSLSFHDDNIEDDY